MLRCERMRLFRLVLRLVYAVNTVATQIVVARERAGEAAGVTLSSLVTCTPLELRCRATYHLCHGVGLLRPAGHPGRADRHRDSLRAIGLAKGYGALAASVYPEEGTRRSTRCLQRLGSKPWA